MKKIKNILLIFTFLVSTAGVVNGQQVRLNADSSAVRTQQDDAQMQKQEKTQTQTQAQTQSQAQSQDKTQSRAQSQKGNATGVKQVHSARPDWSKARGARPASVERPSGSRIPKGVGKPHGANGPGGR